MPLPPVNDRIKEIPAQTLRAVFAGIGQILLIADKLRARAVEQVSGPDAAPAAQPADPAQRADATQRADAARTAGAAGPGDATGPADAAQPVPEAPRRPPRATGKPAPGRAQRGAPPGGTTAPTVAVTGRDRQRPAAGRGRRRPGTRNESRGRASREAAAEPAASRGLPAAAPPPRLRCRSPHRRSPHRRSPRRHRPGRPSHPGPSHPGRTPAAGAGALPLANYDQLSLASLRARLRVLDAAQVSLLLDYEKAHESRPDVVTMFERRIAKLNAGS